MDEQFFSYKFLVTTIHALEFRLAAYEKELSGIDGEDDRHNEIQNDMMVVRSFIASLNGKLRALLEREGAAAAPSYNGEVSEWMVDHVDVKLQELELALGAAFPAAPGAPATETQYHTLTNFFRSGPFRKIVVFGNDGVDFQYDEDASENDDIDLIIANERLFDYVLDKVQALLGPPLGHYPRDLNCIMECISSDDEVEGESCDHTEWSPEYDKGARMDCDRDQTRYWVVNGQNVFLQGGHITGDDDMVCFVAVSITPVVGQICIEGVWPD